MAEPARKTLHGEIDKPASGLPDDEPSGVILLQRWVERPDGRMELLEIPLTPEDFLNPQYRDKWLQGPIHSQVTRELAEFVERHLRSQPEPDVVVLSDVQHLFGPGFDKPCPDVSVVREVRDLRLLGESFDIRKMGVRPSLVIEVVSPKSARIREVDERDKVRLYERAGIPEYLLVRLPLQGTEERFQLWGYRLGPDGRYRPIEPDKEGRILAEQTGLLFGVSRRGDWIHVFNAKTGPAAADSHRGGGSPEAAERRWRGSGLNWNVSRAPAAERSSLGSGRPPVLG